MATPSGPECGSPLAQHPTVVKLSFTGSTEVEKSSCAPPAERIVPVALETGAAPPID
jgi:betaine-aldehyde dehydrogenase